MSSGLYKLFRKINLTPTLLETLLFSVKEEPVLVDESSYIQLHDNGIEFSVKSQHCSTMNSVIMSFKNVKKEFNGVHFKEQGQKLISMIDAYLYMNEQKDRIKFKTRIVEVPVLFFTRTVEVYDYESILEFCKKKNESKTSSLSVNIGELQHKTTSVCCDGSEYDINLNFNSDESSLSSKGKDDKFETNKYLVELLYKYLKILHEDNQRRNK